MCTPKEQKHIIVIIVMIIVAHVIIIVIMVIVLIIVIIVNIITIVIIVIITMGGCAWVGTSVVLGTAVDQRFETTLINIRDGFQNNMMSPRALYFDF